MSILECPSTLRHPSGSTIEKDDSRLLLVNSDFVNWRGKQTGLWWTIVGPLLRMAGLNKDPTTLSRSQDDLFGMLQTSLRERIGAEIEVTSNIRPWQKINNTRWQVWLKTTSEASFDTQAATDLDYLFSSTSDWKNSNLSPVYRFTNTSGPDGRVAPLPHLLKLKASPDSKKALMKAMAKYDLVESPISNYFPSGYFCFILRESKGCTVYPLPELIRQNESSIVEDVWLDYMPAEIPTASVFAPTDPLQKKQWNLNIIHAEAGWNSGTPPRLGQDVVVAIIDHGCDLTHPDLVGTSSTGSAFYSDGAFFSYGKLVGTGEYRDNDRHGTGCTGIIAARSNDLGIVGLASQCQVIPIRITWEPSALIAAIGHAVENAARVISMSLTTSSGYDDPVLKERIRVAFDDENMVLCAAAGNNDQGRLYHPAAHPRVIACGATDQEDERVSSNQNRNIYWGSDYGSDPNPQGDPLSGGFLSVMAPGIDIPTTTNQGLGNWPKDANYRVDFAGTSAATPQVAALAALLIGKNPSLTNQDVRNIIEHTADLVPNKRIYTERKGYSDHLWSEQMGYGRINVEKALKDAGPPYP